MSEETNENSAQHKDKPQEKKEKYKVMKETNSTADILDNQSNAFSALSMAINMMHLSNLESNKDDSDTDLRTLKDEKSIITEKLLLKDRLQDKLNELLDEQQALVDLYVKAARAAREKEEEYRERIAELLEQTEKDRQLMELFRNM